MHADAQNRPMSISSIAAPRMTPRGRAGTFSRDAMATKCRSFQVEPVADIFVKPTVAFKHPQRSNPLRSAFVGPNGHSIADFAPVSSESRGKFARSSLKMARADAYRKFVEAQGALLPNRMRHLAIDESYPSCKPMCSSLAALTASSNTPAHPASPVRSVHPQTCVRPHSSPAAACQSTAAGPTAHERSPATRHIP